MPNEPCAITLDGCIRMFELAADPVTKAYAALTCAMFRLDQLDPKLSAKLKPALADLAIELYRQGTYEVNPDA